MHLTRRPIEGADRPSGEECDKAWQVFRRAGLYLPVDANGSRYWVQRINIRGKRCELGLGSPELVSLAEARAAAMENHKFARSMVTRGKPDAQPELPQPLRKLPARFMHCTCRREGMQNMRRSS